MKYLTEQIESPGSNSYLYGYTSKEAEYLLELNCYCAHELLSWKHAHKIRNIERKGGIEGFSDPEVKPRKCITICFRMQVEECFRKGKR